MSRSATVPLMLETTTIDPPVSASIIACAAARMVSQVPVRFTPSTRCHCSTDSVSNVPDAPMPAQATTQVGTP
jgi:hypothetical protein